MGRAGGRARDGGLWRLALTERPDPRDHFAVGDAAGILRRIREYEAVGISKFVVRPIAEGDDDLMEQTRRLVEEVLPVVHGGGTDGA